MIFSNYMQIVYRYCGAEKSEAEFILSFLCASINNPYDEFLNKYDYEYFRKFFSGNRPFPEKIARYILQNLDKEYLYNVFLNNIPSEDALLEMGHDFENEIGNVELDNIASAITDLFVIILKNIVDTKDCKTETDSSIEDELEKIIKNLSTLTPEKIDSLLSYNPVSIDKKIPNSFALLQKEVKDDVSTYYLYIEDLLKDLDAKNHTLCLSISKKIKNYSNKLIHQSLNYQHVIEEMAEWFKHLTGQTNASALKILVSFFIQHCEVFNEIT